MMAGTKTRRVLRERCAGARSGVCGAPLAYFGSLTDFMTLLMQILLVGEDDQLQVSLY